MEKPPPPKKRMASQVTIWSFRQNYSFSYLPRAQISFHQFRLLVRQKTHLRKVTGKDFYKKHRRELVVVPSHAFSACFKVSPCQFLGKVLPLFLKLQSAVEEALEQN